MGANSDGRRNVSGWTNIISITAGNNHTIGLRSNGTLLVAGTNDYGDLNVTNPPWDNIVEILSQYQHTVALKSDGTLAATGDFAPQIADLSGQIRPPSNAYSASGSLTSSTFDAQGPCNLETISWNATVPGEAGADAVRLQIAANNDNPPGTSSARTARRTLTTQPPVRLSGRVQREPVHQVQAVPVNG